MSQSAGLGGGRPGTHAQDMRPAGMHACNAGGWDVCLAFLTPSRGYDSRSRGRPPPPLPLPPPPPPPPPPLPPRRRGPRLRCYIWGKSLHVSALKDLVPFLPVRSGDVGSPFAAALAPHRATRNAPATESKSGSLVVSRHGGGGNWTNLVLSDDLVQTAIHLFFSFPGRARGEE